MNKTAFPEPIIAVKVPSGLSVLDSGHRMAAFCALQKVPDEKFVQLKLKKAGLEQKVWIGTHSNGEVPLT